MDAALPQLLTGKVIVAEDRDAKTGQVVATTRSRSHAIPEGFNFNALTFAYRPTADERAKLAEGADLYLSQLTYGQQPQDILIHVGVDAAAKYFGVEVATEDELTKRRVKAEDELRTRCADLAAILAAERGETVEEGATPISRDASAQKRRRHQAFRAVEDALGKVKQANLDAGVSSE